LKVNITELDFNSDFSCPDKQKWVKVKYSGSKKQSIGLLENYEEGII